jgi:hypothetical protein
MAAGPRGRRYGPVQSDGLVRPLGAPSAQATPVGVQPGVSGNVLFARLVIISGAGVDGVYVYKAGTTPGLGNPPIAWESSGLVDPYGNVLPSTTGVAGTGTFQAGDTRITTAGIFVYSGAPALGNLIASEANAAGTDTFGNVYYAGVNSYQPSGGATPIAVSQLDAGILSVGNATAMAGTGGALPATFANGGLGVLGSDGGATAAGDSDAGITFRSKNVDGTAPMDIMNGAVAFNNTTNPSTAAWSSVYGDTTAGMIPSAANVNDGQRYRVGSLLATQQSGQLINATGFIGIGATIVGIGSYRMSGYVSYTGTAAAGTPKFSFGGVAVMGHARGYIEFPLTSITVFDGAITGSYVGPTLTLTEQIMRFEFDLPFTAAGTFDILAGENVAGDSFTINYARIRQEAV